MPRTTTRRLGAYGRTAYICRSHGLEHLNYQRMLDDGAVRLGWRALTASNEWSGVPGMDDGPRVQIGIALADRLENLLAAETTSLEPLDELQAGLGMALPVVRRLIGLEGGTILAARESQSLGLRLTLPIDPPRVV